MLDEKEERKKDIRKKKNNKIEIFAFDFLKCEERNHGTLGLYFT